MIDVFCLANNEEKLMPYFMRHYSQFADVTLLESNSTDKTIEIANSMGATIWSYDRPDELDDEFFTDLKNNCWKKSQADWVMIVDADEFIYHHNIVNLLKRTNATIIIPEFWNMYSEQFPTTEGQIYDEITMGCKQDSPPAKMNIFRPGEIQEMNYSPGAHHANPAGNIKIDYDSRIKTLHMRNLSKQFVIERNARHSQRRSQINKDKGWGDHVDFPVSDVMKSFDEAMLKLIKVI
jgi:hypothetical protein